MKKLIIIGMGIVLLLSLAIMTSCEEDGAYTSCSNTCSASAPYSNQNTSSCYSTLSDCENATGSSCTNCN